MEIPVDDFILLSLINTKLRDEYPSFERLCEEEDLNPEEVCFRLSAIGFSYDEEKNAFR